MKQPIPIQDEGPLNASIALPLDTERTGAVDRLTPCHGLHINSFFSALIAVIIIGLFNATLGLFLKIITLPLSIMTFGVFLLIINAFILRFASSFVPGFSVTTFRAAFLGALALAILHLLFGFLRPRRQSA